jgi:hypothetical protein
MKEGYIQYDSFYVAGYRFYDGHTILHKLKCGEELELVRDQFNPYDHRAVEVKTNYNTKLGFIPMDQNQMTAFFIDQGMPVLAQVREVQLDEDEFRPIRVDIFVKLPASSKA